MIIRQLQYKDLPALAELYKGFWNEASDIIKMRKMFREMEHNPYSIILTSVSDNKIIGTITGTICQSLYGQCQPFLIIEDFIVDRNKQRKGIGKALLTAIETEARDRGCNQVLLVTNADRKSSHSFYKSQGYPRVENTGYKKKLKVKSRR